MAEALDEKESMVKDFADKEENHGFWSDLPTELLSSIRSCLVSERDYYIFDIACKSWKASPNLRLQLQFPIDDYSILHESPLLMSISKRSGRYNFFHPLHHTYYMDIPELLNKKILYSKDGWLLVMGGKYAKEKQVFFFNPFTRKKIDLPDLPSNTAFTKFSFYGLPTSEDCVVVGIMNLLSLMEIAVIKPGEDDWEIEDVDFRETDENYPVKKFCISSNPIFVDNYCYCLDVDGKVALFDIHDDCENSLEFYGMRLSRRQRDSLIQSFMVESDGELIAIFLSSYGRISVLKPDASKKNWVNVEDLGDKVIYLSNGGSWVEKKKGFL